MPAYRTALLQTETAARSLESDDLQDIQNNVAQDLDGAGLGQNLVLDLFPPSGKYPGVNSNALIHEGHYTAGKYSHTGTAYIIGESASSDTSSDNSQASRIFTALHETAHYVADRLGVDDGLFKAINQKLQIQNGEYDVLKFSTNLEERTADVAAALYMRSNYGQEGKSAISKWSKMRENLHEKGTDHDTLSSLHMVQSMPDHEIPAHLSIVEATKLAGKLIQNQPHLGDELKHTFGPHEQKVRPTIKSTGPT